MAKVFLDPGHGGSDPGAVANGLKEKDVVLKIARYTRDYLTKNYGNVTVRMSRDSDVYPSLTQRANVANAWGADLFVSIHINAGGGIGYEDYVYNGGVSNDTFKLQNALHTEISKLFGTNRGKKRANYAVLRQTSMPAVLTENGFIDNKSDARFLKNDSNLRKLGEAHAKGIANYCGLKRKQAPNANKSKTSELYRVRSSWANAKSQKGAFAKLSNAKELADKHGYNVYDSKGKQVYSGKKSDEKPSLPNAVYRANKPYPNGSGVRAVQEALASVYFYPKKGAKNNGVDGYYGPNTADAVRRFQSMYGLTADGVYGPKTRAKLLKLI